MERYTNNQPSWSRRPNLLQRQNESALARRDAFQPYNTNQSRRPPSQPDSNPRTAPPLALSQLDTLFTQFFFNNIFGPLSPAPSPSPSRSHIPPSSTPFPAGLALSRPPRPTPSPPISTLSPLDTSTGPCANCNQLHADKDTLRNCIFITIRRSGRTYLSIPPSPLSGVTRHCLILPKHQELRVPVRDYLWDEFEFMRDDTEEKRMALASEDKVPRGDLRARIPIPWLSWQVPDGGRGHTRNKGNWKTVWEGSIEEYMRRAEALGREVCLTSILLPGDGRMRPFDAFDDDE